jgi:hypothetical protein
MYFLKSFCDLFRTVSNKKENTVDILEYVRKRKGGKNYRVGLLLGRKVNGKVYVGWSKCWVKKDEFDPDFGMLIASNRIHLSSIGDNRYRPVHNSIQDQLTRFTERCKRYFKTENVNLA